MRANDAYPAADTPYNALPAAEQSAWMTYVQGTLIGGGPNHGTTTWAQASAAAIVPGASVLSSGPAMPAVANKTDGALSDKDAQAFATAFWHDGQLFMWGAAHAQSGVLVFDHCPNCFAPALVDAMESGTKATEKPCDLFPQSLAIIPVTADVRAWLTAGGGKTAAKFAILGTFDQSADCGYQVDGQAPVADSAGTNYRAVVGGTTLWDPALGDLIDLDSSADCKTVNAVAAYCS